MSPANPGWRPTLWGDVNNRRARMQRISERLVKYFVSGSDSERKTFETVAFYCLSVNVNKTAYDRGVDHSTTGPLAKALQAKAMKLNHLEGAVAFAIQQTPSSAKVLAFNDGFMNDIADRVAKHIGESGTHCFIPEGYEQDEDQAHRLISRAMSEDPHFRYYGKQFVIRVEAAAKFPPPNPASFTPVTSEMRFNMPILSPGDVIAEIDLILAYKSEWEAAESEQARPLETILMQVKAKMRDTWCVPDIYDHIDPGGDEKSREPPFATITIMLAYAEAKIIPNNFDEYKRIYDRVFHARDQAHKSQLKNRHRPIVFGQQSVDTLNPRTTFRHHAWREPSTEDATWVPSPHQLPYSGAPAVNDTALNIDIISPSLSWTRYELEDNRSPKNRAGEFDIIGAVKDKDDVHQEPLFTSEDIKTQLEAQQPNPEVRRWGIDETKDKEIQPLPSEVFADSKNQYSPTDFLANRHHQFEEEVAPRFRKLAAERKKPLIDNDKKPKSTPKTKGKGGSQSQGNTAGSTGDEPNTETDVVPPADPGVVEPGAVEPGAVESGAADWTALDSIFDRQQKEDDDRMRMTGASSGTQPAAGADGGTQPSTGADGGGQSARRRQAVPGANSGGAKKKKGAGATTGGRKRKADDQNAADTGVDPKVVEGYLAEITKKAEEIKKKDHEITKQAAEIKKKNDVIVLDHMKILELENRLSTKDGIIAAKVKLIAEKDAVIRGKDTFIAERDELILRQEARILEAISAQSEKQQALEIQLRELEAAKLRIESLKRKAEDLKREKDAFASINGIVKLQENDRRRRAREARRRNKSAFRRITDFIFSRGESEDEDGDAQME